MDLLEVTSDILQQFFAYTAGLLEHSRRSPLEKDWNSHFSHYRTSVLTIRLSRLLDAIDICTLIYGFGVSPRDVSATHYTRPLGYIIGLLFTITKDMVLIIHTQV